ncbi:TIGR04222 domain-containing membrane protein [Nonomuraea sp. NPDC050547]|uniref:TIGR04222 domain-containing membrane protein n=1 Tax=Nonomuraea sp. NPDC050547 TaxID=3364368 RepID=UPI00378EC342
MDIFLFFAAFALIALISNLSGSVAKQRLKVANATLSQAGHRLTHYELAYLAGGPRRAINTALAVLATAGAVRVSRGAQVSPVHGATISSDPLEQAVLDAVAMRPGHRAAQVRKLLETSPALLALEARLRGHGLLMPEGAQGVARRRLEALRLAAWGAMGFEIALVVLALAGVAGKDFVFAGALLFGGFAVVMGFSGHYKEKRRLRNLVTGEGRRVLESARQYHPRGRGDTSTPALAVAMPVALYGLTELDDRDLCDGLSAGDPHSDCGGSCGSHSDSGSSTFGDGGSGGGDFGGSSSDGGGGSSGSSCGGGGGGSSCGSSS